MPHETPQVILQSGHLPAGSEIPETLNRTCILAAFRRTASAAASAAAARCSAACCARCAPAAPLALPSSSACAAWGLWF